jgi:hypothetical protein
MGIGGLALIDLLGRDRLLEMSCRPKGAAPGIGGVKDSPYLPKPLTSNPGPSDPPLFMSGGVSHVDTFD